MLLLQLLLAALVPSAHAGTDWRDVWYWDDTLPMGEGVGLVVDGYKVLSYDNGHYILQASVEVPATDVRVKVTRPKRVKMGEIDVQVSAYGDDRVVGLLMPKMLALAPCETIEVCGTPVEAWTNRTETAANVIFRTDAGKALVVPAPLPPHSDLRLLTDRAPFPVLVTFRKDGRIQVFSGEVELPPDAIEPAVGDRVALLDHRQGTVGAIRGDRVTVVLETIDRTTPLPNPENLDVPMWFVEFLVFAVVGSVVVLLRFLRRAR